MWRPAALRQLLFPREFRIAPASWPSDLATLVERAASAPRRETTPVAPDPSAPLPVEPPSMQFLADVGTGLWRLRQRMVQPGTDRPLEEMRRAFRHLESTCDALAVAGVQILDHTGTAFDAGLAIKVLAYQPTPGVTRERVIETIKPTVYYKQDRLQMGEVIVGTPDDTSDPSSGEAPARTAT